jgi:hypothetical protein
VTKLLYAVDMKTKDQKKVSQSMHQAEARCSGDGCGVGQHFGRVQLAGSIIMLSVDVKKNITVVNQRSVDAAPGNAGRGGQDCKLCDDMEAEGTLLLHPPCADTSCFFVCGCAGQVCEEWGHVCVSHHHREASLH